MAAINTFRLPDLGEGLTEADLLTWLVNVGDTVELNQIIAEVETAKASVELPSPYTGTVTTLHVQQGDTIAVGAALIDIEGAESETHADPTSAAPAREETSLRNPVLVGYGVTNESAGRRRRRRTPAATPPALHHNASGDISASQPLAAPPVRFAARQLGIDLADIEPTGAHGQVTRDDLDRVAGDSPTRPAANPHQADDRSAAPATIKPQADAETRTPIKGVRKHIAEAMVSSAFTAPHVTEFITVDVSPSMELLEQLRDTEYFANTRVTPLTLVANAVLIALRTNPSLNSSWDEPAQRSSPSTTSTSALRQQPRAV